MAGRNSVEWHPASAEIPQTLGGTSCRRATSGGLTMALMLFDPLQQLFFQEDALLANLVGR